MFESLYPEFRTGQIIEMLPKPGFEWVLEAAEITKSLTHAASDPALTVGDPEGIRDSQQLSHHVARL
jgi:hypothetical protein